MDERRLEITRAKRLLYNKIRELITEKNRIEMEVSSLKAEYQALDKELAEMNITYCKPKESGKRRPKPITMTMDQVQELADKLGVSLKGVQR